MGQGVSSLDDFKLLCSTALGQKVEQVFDLAGVRLTDVRQVSSLRPTVYLTPVHPVRNSPQFLSSSWDPSKPLSRLSRNALDWGGRGCNSCGGGSGVWCVLAASPFDQPLHHWCASCSLYWVSVSARCCGLCSAFAHLRSTRSVHRLEWTPSLSRPCCRRRSPSTTARRAPRRRSVPRLPPPWNNRRLVSSHHAVVCVVSAFSRASGHTKVTGVAESVS